MICCRFFCNNCIENHGCPKAVKEAAIDPIILDDYDDSDDGDYVPKKSKRSDEDLSVSDHDEEDSGSEEEVDNYDALDDKQGKAAKGVWTDRYTKNGFEVNAEKHGLSRDRKVREKAPSLGKRTKTNSNQCNAY